MSAQGGRTVFLTLPVACTGGLWHHAAAQILHNTRKISFYDLITVLGAVDEERNFHGSFARGPAVFDYFLGIGMPCALARISFPDGAEAELSHKMLSLDNQCYMRIFEAQKSRSKPFDVLWPQIETINNEEAQETRGIVNQGEHRIDVLHYYISTTIMMQHISLDTSREQRNAHIYELGEALGRISNKDTDIDHNVACKIAELRALIATNFSSASSGISKGRVLLYNWRGSSTYSGHGSLKSHLEQIRRHARFHGMSIIRVAAGVPPGEIQDTDLDLFDTRVSNVVRDKRFTARFWNRVQQIPEVFGLIGERSGSLDVVAFVGMNCFEWDEPVFNIAVDALEFELKHLPSKEYIELQVPQYLRLLNRCSFINIGLLDASSYDYENKIFARLETEELDRWLFGELDVYPPCPDTEKVVSVYKGTALMEKKLIS